MSELSQLKQTINGLADSARKTGANLASFDRQFGQQTQRVQAAIGGSAQRKDQEVVAALQQASRAVKQATAALANAAKIASNYGHSL